MQKSKLYYITDMKKVDDYGLPPRETLILGEYREKSATYGKLLEVVKGILADSIKSNNLYINALEGRVKAEASFCARRASILAFPTLPISSVSA